MLHGGEESCEGRRWRGTETEVRLPLYDPSVQEGDGDDGPEIFYTTEGPETHALVDPQLIPAAKAPRRDGETHHDRARGEPETPHGSQQTDPQQHSQQFKCQDPAIWVPQVTRYFCEKWNVHNTSKRNRVF